MGKIQDCPKEVLLRIFELGVRAFPPNPDERDTLCAISLVCRDWRDPGQATLWQSVDLYPVYPLDVKDSDDDDLELIQSGHAKTAQNFAGSDATARGLTRGLRFDGIGIRCEDMCALVLRSSYGLRSLELSDVIELDAAVLEYDALKNLQRLRLYQIEFCESTPTRQLRSTPTRQLRPTPNRPLCVPFRLHHLAIDASGVPPPPYLLPSLLSTSTTSFSYSGYMDDSGFEEVIAHAPHLKALDFSSCGGTDIDENELEAIFSSCESLEDLKINGKAIFLLSALPGTQLVSLKITRMEALDDEGWDDLFELFENKNGCLKSLKVMIVDGSSDKVESYTSHLLKTRQLCARRGIKLYKTRVWGTELEVVGDKEDE